MANLSPAARNILLALVIAMILTAAWTAKDFAQLSIGRLPDNDDMMRIAQVRDWIGGQAFNDLMQYRLGPDGGASMHWSRIADAGPAILVTLFTPLLGAKSAELAMFIAYPAILFFLYLLLMGRIARRLSGAEAETVGIIVAALAFPTISLFVPGRIDHHGLQILLMLVVAEALIARPSFRAGLAAGVAMALSLAIGLEAAPEIVAAMAALVALWISRGQDETGRAGGLAIGLGAVTLLLLAVARPTVWPQIWCDGFTPASSKATLAAAACWAALALAGYRWPGFRPRLLVSGFLGAAGAFFVLKTSSVCFTGPYGALDPFLTRVWMDKVDEARSVFGQTNPGTAIAFGGLCVAGLIAMLHRFATKPDERARWLGFTIFLVLGVIAAMLQIRVTYILAALAAIPLTALIVEIRACVASGHAGFLTLAGAWIVAAGFTYNAAGNMVDALAGLGDSDVRAATKLCVSGKTLAEVARLRPGRIFAPLDSGAYLIGMTPHRVVAAPYHRNNAGNIAMYRFFLSPPERSRAIARRWRADYVILCPTSFDEIDLGREGPGGLAVLLKAGTVPGWLERIPVDGSLQVYRIR